MLRLVRVMPLQKLLQTDAIGLAMGSPSASDRGSADLQELREELRRLRAARDELAEGKQRLERELVETQTELVLSEKARYEMQAYEAFARKLHSSYHFYELIDEIFDYVRENFGVEVVVLYLVDRETHELYYCRSRMPRGMTERIGKRLRETRIPLNESGGVHARTFQRQRSAYLPRIRRSSLAIDDLAAGEFGLSSLFMAPLVVENEGIGLIDFTNYSTRLNLTREDIRSIESFCNQIAGAVRSALLLSDAEDARRRADAALREAERSRQELERLTDISRRINSTSNIDELLEMIFSFIQKNFGIEGIWMQFLDEESGELYTYRTARTVEIDEEKLQYIRNLRVPLNEEGGAAYRVYRRRRRFYMAKEPRSYFSEIDRRHSKELGIVSALLEPLVIRDQTIGVVTFTRFGTPLNLSRHGLDSITRFCEQISGAIHNSRLHAGSELSRMIAEQQIGRAHV